MVHLRLRWPLGLEVGEPRYTICMKHFCIGSSQNPLIINCRVR